MDTIWLDYEGAAARAQVSVWTVRRRVKDGTMVAHKMGRLVRFRPEDVDAAFAPKDRGVSA